MIYEEMAREGFERGLNCSMAVYSAFAEELGLYDDEIIEQAPIPRAEGGKCGAYLAGRQVLAELNPSAVEEFEKRFMELNGSCECAPLLKRHELLKKTCADYVGDAAALVEELL